MFKLVGLGIGPLLALLGFVWGLVDKAELRFLTRELGKAEEKAAASERDAQAERVSSMPKRSASRRSRKT